MAPRMAGFSSQELRLPPAAMLLSLSGVNNNYIKKQPVFVASHLSQVILSQVGVFYEKTDVEFLIFREEVFVVFGNPLGEQQSPSCLPLPKPASCSTVK